MKTLTYSEQSFLTTLLDRLEYVEQSMVDLSEDDNDTLFIASDKISEVINTITDIINGKI